MAGIFANVDSDIQKLQKLKMEIENVKKALKQINVKVDIDIAKGMEAQLQSLMGQYDALVRKVSEAEGKITLSTKRINDASEKIIKAQEQLSKAVGVNPRPGSGNANTTANNTETTSVQAQAKAYDELEAEINKVLGTREQNIRKLIEESNAIKLNQRLIKQTEKEYTNSNGVISEKGLKLLEIYNNNLLRHKATLSEVQQVLRNEEKLYNASENSMSRLSQELSRMRIAYRAMTDDAKNSPFGKELLASIDQADAKIKSLDASIGNHQRNVGNYASGWNGLNMSVQQIVRELPAATMGLNMFFLAISNNLPILTDEIKRAKERNAELIAQNQKATPVWKQLVSSIFSWQTAMMVGITILSTYGKDIVNWVKGLFSAEKQLDATVEAQKKLNEAQLEGTKNAQSELIKLKLLRSLAEDESKHRSERLKAVSKLQSMYPNYLGNIDKEKILAGQVSDAYYQLTTNLKNAAIAKAKFDKAVSVAKEAEELKDSWAKIISETNPQFYSKKSTEELVARVEELKKEREKTQQEVNKVAAMYGRQGSIVPKSNEEEALENILKAYNEWQKKVKELESISKGVDVSSLIYNPDDEKRKIEEAKRQAEKALQIRQKIADELIQLQKTNQQREIDLMKEGSEKKIAQINLDYKEQIEAIKKQADSWEKEQGGTLTSEQTMQVSIAYSRSKKIKDRDISETYQEELDVYQEELNNLLKQYQGFDAKRRAIEDKYTKDLQILESRRTSSNSTEINASINELNYQKEEALNQIAMEFATRNEEFELWMNEIATYSLEKLQETLRAAQAELGTLKIAGGGGNKLAEAEAKVIAIQNEIANQNKKTNTSPEKRSVKEWQELYKTLSKVDSQFQEVGDSIGGTAGELLSSAGNISTAIVSMIDGIITLASGSIQAVEGVSKAAANAIRAVESASVILAIISAALQVVTKIFSLVKGKSKAEKDSERLSKVTNKIEETNEIINKLIEKRIDLIKEATSAERAGLELTTKEAIKAQQDLIQVQYSKLQGNEILGKKGKNNDLDVEDLGLTTVEQLKAFLENEKVWFNGAYTTLVELEKQGYGLTDKDKWYSIVEEWEKLNEQADELEKTTSEINTGINFDEARDGLDDFLLSADTTFKDISDNFEDYMRQSILNVVKSDYLNKEMQEWYKDFDKMAEDGPLSSTEVDYLRKEYENIYSEAQNKINGMLAAAGIGLKGSSSSRESSKKGFATASQDSIDSLEGRFTAGQIAWEETKNQAVMQNEKLSILDLKVESLLNISSEQRNIADETRTILANSYLELQQINENTGAIIKPITEMRDKMNSWDSKIRNM